MNDQEYSRLREQSWIRTLTPSEEAALRQYLADRPELRDEWLDDGLLNKLLERLPEAPAVSSNFTSRVMQEIEREESLREREQGRSRFRNVWRWLPRIAIAGLTAFAIFAGYVESEARNHVALAKDAARLSSAVSASNPELMKDLDPIMRLPEPQPKVDVELIALLK